MKSLNKVLDVIEYLADNGETGVRELSAKMDIPPPTIHRIVTTLSERGYLIRNKHNQQYSLSLTFLTLGELVQQKFNITAIAHPYLEELTRKTGENANLCVRDRWEIIYIDHIHSSKHNLMFFTSLGARAPLYATGAGKVFLSGFSDKKLNDYLDETELVAFTPYTITDAATLRQEILKIKEFGYAEDNQEKESGVQCMAAPIFDQNEQIVATISISGSVLRLTNKKMLALKDIVLHLAGQISAEIGYNRKWPVSKGIGDKTV